MKFSILKATSLALLASLAACSPGDAEMEEVVAAPPAIAPLSDQVIDEDGSLTLEVVLSDSDTFLRDLELSATSNNPSLIAEGGISLMGDSATRSLRIVPLEDAFGAATVTLTVDDGQATASVSFELTVNAVNDAPTISDIGPQTVNEDTPTGAISFSVSDLETAPSDLVVTASSDNPNLVVESGIAMNGSGSTRSVSVTPLAEASGLAVITITVSDGELESSDTFGLTVGEVGDAPLISDVPDQQIDEDESTTVAFTVADVDTDLNSLEISVASSNQAVVAAGNVMVTGSGESRSISIMPAENAFGQTIITVTVSDGNDTVADSFQLLVSSVDDPPIAPVANASPGQLAVGESAPIVCDMSSPGVDVDGDPVTHTIAWQADGRNYPAEFAAATGPATTVVANDTIPEADLHLAWEWTCTITATDGITDVASQPSTSLAAKARDCMALHTQSPDASDGNYVIDVDGQAGPLAPLAAFCDMTTDGGGWTMILNYVHQGGTNPELEVRTADYPIMGAGALGDDESGTESWGHASPEMVAALYGERDHELRYFGESSGHERVMNFKTTACVSYFAAGTGNCKFIGTTDRSTILPGHTATLPGFFADEADTNMLYRSNRLEFAMTELPWFVSGTAHWAIRASGRRWEVDDFPNTEVNDTIHRIFARPLVPAGAPSAPEASLAPAIQTIGQTAPFVCTLATPSTDNEGDLITYSVRWQADGLDYPAAFAGAIGPETTVIAGDTVPAADVELAWDWSCTIVASDGSSDVESEPSSGLAEKPQDCAALLAAQPSTTDGNYAIDVDGRDGPLAPFAAFCDMTSDGGGWTMVLNYVHQGGTNPALDVRTSDLPTMGLGALGDDESGSASWGHAGPAMMTALYAGRDFELRFYGQSSGHSRVMNFKTIECADYFASGEGNCKFIGTAEKSSPLPGHTTSLPGFFATEAETNLLYKSNRLDFAMTEQPFLLGGSAHWAIRSNDRRWELDDYPNDDSNDTLHRIFARPL